MIGSILPALGPRPTLRIVYVAPLPRAPLTRLHPAFSPFGLPVHLIASPHFDELRRPANLALQVTFNVIYPAAPACSRVDSFAPAHSDIRPSHCAAPGAGAELVVLVFEQDVERGEAYFGQKLSTVRSSAPFECQMFKRNLPLTLPSDSPSGQVARSPKHKGR